MKQARLSCRPREGGDRFEPAPAATPAPARRPGPMACISHRQAIDVAGTLPPAGRAMSGPSTWPSACRFSAGWSKAMPVLGVRRRHQRSALGEPDRSVEPALAAAMQALALAMRSREASASKASVRAAAMQIFEVGIVQQLAAWMWAASTSTSSSAARRKVASHRAPAVDAGRRTPQSSPAITEAKRARAPRTARTPSGRTSLRASPPRCRPAAAAAGSRPRRIGERDAHQQACRCQRSLATGQRPPPPPSRARAAQVSRAGAGSRESRP